jgi:hypothetical protein
LKKGARLFSQVTERRSAAAKGLSLGFFLALLLVGCTAERQTTESLAGACQLVPCVCADTKALFWQTAKTVPLLWKENGEAYCPPDYALLRVPKDKKKKR